MNVESPGPWVVGPNAERDGIGSALRRGIGLPRRQPHDFEVMLRELERPLNRSQSR
ncbi:MAG TPA: hypothetical protein VIV07_04630 [Sphingomicrobium sp.]